MSAAKYIQYLYNAVNLFFFLIQICFRIRLYQKRVTIQDFRFSVPYIKIHNYRYWEKSTFARVTAFILCLYLTPAPICYSST